MDGGSVFFPLACHFRDMCLDPPNGCPKVLFKQEVHTQTHVGGTSIHLGFVEWDKIYIEVGE